MVIIGIAKLTKTYHERYLDQIKIAKNLGIVNYIMQSPYGAHYHTAIKIFERHKFFGVGLKNFRTESQKEIYINSKLEFNDEKSIYSPSSITL